jgi:hypothetical protein
MGKDNITGKNKDFYDLGKKIFDRLNPQGAINPKIIEYVEPKKEWAGLTNEEVMADDVLRYHFALNGGAGPISKKGLAIIAAVDAKLKEKNGQ